MSEPKSNVSTDFSKAMSQDKLVRMLTQEPEQPVPRYIPKPDKEFHVAYFIDENTLSGVNVSAPDIAQAISKACAEHNVPLHSIAYIAQHGIRISIVENKDFPADYQRVT